MAAPLLVAIAAAATLAVLLALLPVRLVARIDRRRDTPLRARVELAGPLAGRPVLVLVDTDRARRARRGRRRRRPGWSGRGRAGAAALRAAPRLAARLVRAVHIERLRVDAAFGFPDPADTGAAWGAFCALGPFLPARASVALHPVFDGPALHGSAEAAVRFRPAGLLGPLIRFAVEALRKGAG